MSAETPSQPDMLRAIFRLQGALNDHVFQKNGIVDSDGKPLSMQKILDEASAGELSVNGLPNQWLSRYARALEAELDELKDELLWKWWSNDDIDLQNIRVELVDILHFLVSAMLAAGLDADRVHDIYVQKHSVNLSRQDAGYNQATKTEDDNRTIQ